VALAAALGIAGVVWIAGLLRPTTSGPESSHTPAEITEQKPEAPVSEGARPAAPAGPVATARPQEILGVRPPAAPPGSAAPSELYAVQASVIRVDRHGRREQLDQGAKLALGDLVSLEFEASKDVYLYVINEDEQGSAYALFPLPDFDLQNPLPGGSRHEIPGRIDGKSHSWEVDTSGGREHLMLLASPERLVDFETEMARLARPRTGELAVPIPDDLKQRLRGLGSVRARSETSKPDDSIGRLFEMAQRLAGESDVVRGAWLRRFDLENPTP
jgi:hypothetical protein